MGAAAGRGVCASLQLFGSRRAGCMAPTRALLRRDEGGSRSIGSVIGPASLPRVIAVFRRELVRAVTAPGSARGRNGKWVVDVYRVTLIWLFYKISRCVVRPRAASDRRRVAPKSKRLSPGTIVAEKYRLERVLGRGLGCPYRGRFPAEIRPTHSALVSSA